MYGNTRWWFYRDGSYEQRRVGAKKTRHHWKLVNGMFKISGQMLHQEEYDAIIASYKSWLSALILAEA